MIKIKLSIRNFIFTVVHVHQVKTLWLRPWAHGTRRASDHAGVTCFSYRSHVKHGNFKIFAKA